MKIRNLSIPTIFIAILTLSGCVAPLKPLHNSTKNFVAPSTGNFAWGISSSSYQFEDPAVHPGQPDYFQTDWDIMVAQGGASPKGNALYSWTHFDKDVEALRKVGATHYRFSIEWARVEPRPGYYNEAAIRGYVRMVDKLKAAGIEPVVCLWHFTFPDWLYDKKHPAQSNWLHPLVRERWNAYVNKMCNAFGSKVRYYAPQNEPNGQITTAYLGGLWPPRETLNFGNYNKSIVASADMFRDAAKIIKNKNPHAIVMSVEALPFWTHSPMDVTWAFYNAMEHNNFDHLDRVYDVCDIIGFNYYYTEAAGLFSFLTVGSRHGHHYSMMGWRISPQDLLEQVKIVSARYGRPMMVTENGIATHGKHDDWKRTNYLHDHIAALQQAQKEGYDVRGYFVWSLADNYEWHYGYIATFGLAKMDPKTYTRKMKPSGDYYRDVIQKDKASKQILVN